MASFLIGFYGTSIVLAFAAIVLAGIYFLPKMRSAVWRLCAAAVWSLCLAAFVWGLSPARKERKASNARTSATISSKTHANAATPAVARTPGRTAITATTLETQTPRAVYGHSLVKGGIHSLGELMDVIARDPLAAQHYKGFDITQAHFMRLNHNVFAYVSYRVDGAGIFWTSKPKLILAGEEVISDGTNYIRVRCGNMISYAQQGPVRPDEPPDTDTIVETFPAIAPPSILTPQQVPQSYIPPSASPAGPPSNTPPVTPSGPPTTIPFGGYVPTPTVFPQPYSPGTAPIVPVVPPPIVGIDEFSVRASFYTLFATIALLFLIKKLTS
jgi:hypothetical protein